MQTVSSAWEDLLAQGAHREFKFEINGVTYDHSRIFSASVSRFMMEKFSVGNACAATLQLTFAPMGEIPSMARIDCYVRLVDPSPEIYLGDEAGNVVVTEDGFILAAQYAAEPSEWLPFGTFYIDTRSTDAVSGCMTVTAYDAMLLAEADYIDQTGTYPMAMADAVAFIAGEIGVEVDARNAIYDGSIDCPTNVYTMREVLRFIAAASGGNFVISEAGKLRLIPLASPDEAQAAHVCSSCRALGNALTVTGVQLLPDSDTQYTAGDDTGYVISGECAYATQAMANTLLQQLSGLIYRPFEAADVRLDPAAELGDAVTAGGIHSVLAYAVVTLNVAMPATIRAPVETEVEHEIPYQARSREQRITASSFSEIRKSTAEIALEVSGKLDEDDAQTLIQTNLEGITLSATAGANSSTIKIMANGIEVDSQVVRFSSITADKVYADDIEGNLLSSQIDLYGELTVWKTSSLTSAGGYMGYTSSTLDGKPGLHLESAGGTSEVRVTDSGAAMEGPGGKVVCTSNCNLTGQYIYFNTSSGSYEMAPTYFAPQSSGDLYCGLSGQRWNTVYCVALNESSDRALKANISYGNDRYDAFFDRLKPCTHTFKAEDGGATHTRLIAQDVDEALAASGLARSDFAGLCMSDREGESGIVYSEFVSILIDQVQKLKSLTQDLQRRIEALESHK